jgi:VWFA-related protein
MIRRRVLAAIGLCASVIALSAQTQTPEFRAITRLVEVNVIVHDRHGQPIENLSRDDFELFDEGEKQDIAAMRLERTQPQAGAPAPITLPANQFSNQPIFHTGATEAVTVVLMDGLNTAFADQAHARDQLIRFLGTLTPNDRVALYSLGRDLRVLHDFTDDAASLLRALQKRKLYLGSELADSQPDASDTGNAELDAFLDRSNQGLADFQTADRVGITLRAIEAIARHVSALPGRKNLVWISGGFPFSIGMDEMSSDTSRDSRSFNADIDHTARAVAAASLAIYPVDARGLVTPPALGRDSWNPHPSGPPPLSSAMKNLQQTQDSMRTLAKRTGGRAYFNTNDLANAVRGAIDDARVTYVLSYYPKHNAWNGKFRQLKVAVKRPGVDVRYRLGYFAFADEPQTDVARKSALMDAVSSPIDATGIGITIRLQPDVPSPGTLRVQAAVDPRALALTRAGDRWTGEVDALYIVQDAADSAPVVTAQTLALNLTQRDYAESMQTGLQLSADLDGVKFRYRVKVVVRDAATGNIGSVTARPSPAK